jgi:pimeloyl-ACP methyl ester carboxylesterase
MSHFLCHYGKRLLPVFCWLFLVTDASAELVSLALGANLAGNAEYRKGDPTKPAVLILHGFLQTQDFPIVYRLTEGLSAEGHGVLAPTLTLGVTHRRQSLACEAIHSHTMADGIREIEAWIKWLKARHPGPIVVLGHSLGSLTLLAYLDKGADPAVVKFIGVSIMEGRVHANPREHDKAVEALRKLVREGRREPTSQPYSFCKSLNAVPKSLLSYLEWTPARVMRTSQAHIKDITYIMGSRDDRLGPGWIERLARTGVRVRIIQGANHFMDGAHEFDLLDTVLDELKAIPRQ